MRIENGILKMVIILAVLAPAMAFAGTSGPSPIPPAPNFQISSLTTTLCRGTINDVRIKVSNLNTAPGSAVMQNVQLGVGTSKSLASIGNGTTSTENVSPGNSLIVHMPVFVNFNASSLINAQVGINYNYFSFYTDSEYRNISFGIQTCPSPLAISIYPKVLTSGKIENVTFNLTNTGKTTLNNISIRAALQNQNGQQSGEVLTSQPVLVNAIAPMGSALLNESVFINRNASQTFPINLSIVMYNGTKFEQITDSQDVLSSGVINITLSGVTLSPSAPAPGDIFSISFVLTDLGTTGATAVTATALGTKGFTPYGSPSVFVGDMQVDSQTPVTLTLKSGASMKGGNYTIPVRINYLNNLRQNLSSTIEVPVEISGVAASFNALSGAAGKNYVNGSRSSGHPLITLVLIIIIVVLAILYYKERKKHSKK